LNPNSNSLFSI